MKVPCASGEIEPGDMVRDWRFPTEKPSQVIDVRSKELTVDGQPFTTYTVELQGEEKWWHDPQTLIKVG